MIGYEKPFKLGRSLFDKKSSKPFVINSTGTIYQFAKGITSVLLMGKNVLGL
jgi:hypothetical protein